MTKVFLGIMLMGAMLMTGCDNKNNTSTVRKDSTNTIQTSENRADKTSASDTTQKQSGLSKDFTDDMQKMMDDMLKYQFTGDIDIDQANLWIMHHKGGIELLNDYLSDAKDSAMKSLAEHMLGMHKAEVKDLENFTKDKKPNAAGFKDKAADFQKKATELVKSLKLPSGTQNASADKLFAIFMIPHHQQAADMLSSYLEVGKDAKLKQMATKSIKDTKQEIGEMQKMSSK